MTLKTALFDYLSNDAGVVAIVGDQVDGVPGIYPMTAPASAGDPPWVTYQELSRISWNHMLAISGLVRSRLEVDAWATTPLVADALAEAVRLAMDGFRGLMGDEELDVRSCFLEDAQDDYEPPQAAEGRVGLYRVRQDYFIAYMVEIPSF